MKPTFTLLRAVLIFAFFVVVQKSSAQTFNTLALNDSISNDYIFVPNTFTPNNDRINDVFQVKGTGLAGSEFEIGIYDRWGRCVFQSQNINTGWDGKVGSDDAPEDVYIYKVRVLRNHREYVKLGKITLVR